MQIYFNAISEAGRPGPKWQKIFNSFWPAYKAWFISKDAIGNPDLKTSQAALRRYMPEMMPTYQRLCELAGNDPTAARFLTGYQPPAYISGCSQAVIAEDVIQLVRNYDYHPDLTESVQLLSAWNGKKVIANQDCLSGALDGMNEDGLVISLTFGGRKVVGKGFGIPFILRYVLEFCSDVQQAVEALQRVPSHMAYNVTVIDKTGAVKTVQMAPDKKPLVTDAMLATNHQGQVDWPENALFNKTVERADFLEELLSEKSHHAPAIVDAFLRPPLYNTRFEEGFGTLYTAVYRPVEETVIMHWPEDSCTQSFDNFQELSKQIVFEPTNAPLQVTDSTGSISDSQPIPATAAEYVPADWQHTVAEAIANSTAPPESPENKKLLSELRAGIKGRGQVPWELLADFWARLGDRYWKKWQK